MSLYPTPTRIALLDQILRGHVFRDAVGESYIAADRKVTAAIAEMHRAGWVELDDSRPVHYWRLTTTGRAALGPLTALGELVCATYSKPGNNELMIRRVPDGKAHVYWLYVNGARAYGPYWRGDDAYDRLKQLGGRP